jgi:hypothetical protein
MMDCAGGIHPASPAPTPTRAANRCQKFCAAPLTAVIALHVVNAIAMMFLRTPRSAQRAIGIPQKA